MSAIINLHSEEDSILKLESDSVNLPDVNIIDNVDYNILENKPSIEGNELIGDKTLGELGINKDSLDITSESLGITPESIGMGSADTYSIYSLFHS